MQVETRQRGSVLYAEVTSALELQTALARYDDLLQEWKGTDATGVLIDCRGLAGTLSPLERYDVGLTVAESFRRMRAWGRPPPRIALVAVPPLLDRRRLLETVASNRGALLRAFEAIEEADAWLEADAPPSDDAAGRVEPAGPRPPPEDVRGSTGLSPRAVSGAPQGAPPIPQARARSLGSAGPTHRAPSVWTNANRRTVPGHFRGPPGRALRASRRAGHPEADR